MLAILSDYSEYIKVDIFVKNNKITNYKVYLKSNLEDITNIKTEEELRKNRFIYYWRAYRYLYFKRDRNTRFWYGK